MTTVALILAALLVLLLLCFVVNAMFSDFGSWIFFTACGTPGALLRVLGSLVAAIAEGVTGND